MVDIGCPGRHSDGGVLSSSVFGRKLQSGELGFPGATNLLRDLQVELPVNNRGYCPPNAIDSEDVNGNVVEGSWRQEEERSCLQDIPRVGANTFGADATAIRQNLKNYFISEAGGVPWQWEHVRRT
ncbi:hypothetical protein SKAU_G00061320 [Synaphobranchus kaupii]|uniref:Uncharacterized protein n=1 Tax=Synaphobranchus kaupii TaxID=118154 RepID=A0A9Q1G5X8_SYNKA|nr:hypothetical protein SKAU_G00061320 [Synaphobranchus kaupii]